MSEYHLLQDTCYTCIERIVYRIYIYIVRGTIQTLPGGVKVMQLHGDLVPDEYVHGAGELPNGARYSHTVGYAHK